MANYEVFIEPDVYEARRRLPGNVRHRILHLIDSLAQNPRPSNSRLLDLTGLELPPNVEVRRLRVEKWRILYAVNESDVWVWVLAVRQRPPYNYEDLDALVDRIR